MAGKPTPRGRILIVDDDQGVRTLLSSVLNRAGFATLEEETGEEALEAARREEPELVVLDVCLPGISGYEVCRELRDRFGDELPIVFVSGERVESLDRVAGLLVGADDYLVKPFAPDELLARVRRLVRHPAEAPGVAAKLTSREFEVLRLLAEGLQQAEIASRLVISPKTVATHIEHVLAKLGVHNRAQAVAFAYRDGLLSTIV